MLQNDKLLNSKILRDFLDATKPKSLKKKEKLKSKEKDSVILKRTNS